MDKYTRNISQIANIYGIPTTTLYFWEKQGLLAPPQNPDNGYREFDINKAFAEIGDVYFFRSIGLPIREIKKLKNCGAAELRKTLDDSHRELEEKISNYTLKLRIIEEKLQQLDEILNAKHCTFAEEDIPFERAIYLDRADKKHIRRYLLNPNCFVTVGDVSRELKKDVNCLAVEKDFEGKTIFEKHAGDKYVASHFRAATHNTANNDFGEVTDALRATGAKFSRYITQFVICACDENGTQYDYYRVWFLLDR